MSKEIGNSFIARIHRYNGEEDDPSYQKTHIIDIAESSEGEVEIAWDEGRKRTYLRFRLEDLTQALAAEGKE